MTTYHPISCDRHSRYELLVMHGTRHQWHYQDAQGLENITHGVAIDLITHHKEEFILIQKDDHSTVTIRLDRITRYQ